MMGWYLGLRGHFRFFNNLCVQKNKIKVLFEENYFLLSPFEYASETFSKDA